MVSRLDRSVGEVMALLKELKLEDDTVVFFSSDNGPQGNQWRRVSDFFDGNGPFRGYKGEFHEGGIRVPLIARWPGKIKAGTTSDHICAFWDVMPTLADLAGAETPKNIDGISFAPTLLAKGEQKEHEFLYWEMGRGTNLTQAVRLGNWKALRSRASGGIELYDLKSDIGETTNVAAEHPEVIARVKRLFTSERTEDRNYPPEKAPLTAKDYVH
jgi:arylsulfatase A-like enzyme